MDGGFLVNLEDLMQQLDSAQVVSVYFPMLRKTLLVDTRATLDDAPIVKIAPMVTSIEERFRAIRRLRPQLPRPEAITVLPWPRCVDSLVRLGIWQRIVERLADGAHLQALRDLDEALEQLRQLEREELAAVITGKNYHTLWPAQEER